jgi:hypothetical protein
MVTNEKVVQQGMVEKIFGSAGRKWWRVRKSSPGVVGLVLAILVVLVW